LLKITYGFELISFAARPLDTATKVSMIEKFLVITDFGELDFYQAQAIVGARMVTHNILILQEIFA